MRRRPKDGASAATRCGGRPARIAVAALCVLALAAGSASAAVEGPTPAPIASERLRLFAGIEPVAFLVERVAGPRADVDVLVGAGRDPHTYDPEPSQLVRLAESRLYFCAGLPLEANLAARVKEQNPHFMVIDTSEGIRKRAAGEGHDGRGDPHVWMSPRLAKAMASNICSALVQTDPSHAAEYRRDLEALDRDLDAVDAEIAAALSPFRGQSFYVFHPAFGYFADRYGLTQIAVESEGKEPGPKALAALIDRARADGVKVIFVEPQFSTLSAEAIAREIGGAVVSIDPLAHDYIENMRSIAGAVADALGPAGTSKR